MLTPVYFNEIKNEKKFLLKAISFRAILVLVTYVFSFHIFEAIESLGLINLFQELEIDLFLNISIFAMLIYTAYHFRNEIIKKHLLPSPVSLLNHVTIIICYLILRKNEDFPQGIFINNVPVTYFDIILFIGSFYIWSLNRYGSINTNEKDISFIEDVHDENTLDLFDRNTPIVPGKLGIISEIAKAVNNTKTKQAFSVAIVGEWGSGKSTTLYYLKKELEAEKINIIINFNPWKAGSKSDIYECFFDELEVELKKYNNAAAKVTKQYAKALSGVYQDNKFLAFIEEISSVNSNNDLSSKFNDVNEAIRQTGLRFIVIIDDLDRLTSQEIFDVLKLIRSVASFQNLFFVSAFDIDYVINALEKSSTITNAEKYLHKIFQFVMPLTPIRKNLFAEQFHKLFAKNLKVNEHEMKEFNLALERISSLRYKGYDKPNGIFEDTLTSFRDLKRFFNSFQISYNILKDEVEVRELILIELLKQHYPKAYTSLSKGLLTNNHFTNGYLVINDQVLQNLFPKENDNNRLLHTLLGSLFSSDNKSHKSIVNHNVFLILTHYQLFYSISSKEWMEARKKSFSDFYKDIECWLQQGKKVHLANLIINNIPRNNYHEYLNHITLTMVLNPHDSQYFKMVSVLIDALKLYNKCYRDKNLEIEFANLMKNQLIDNSTKGELIQAILFHYHDDTIDFLSVDFLQKQALYLLKDEIEKNASKYKKSVRYISFCCIYPKQSRSSKLIILDNAKEMLVDYINSVGDTYLEYFLHTTNGTGENGFFFDFWLKQIFNYSESKDEFFEFTSKLNPFNELTEITLKLFREYKDIFDTDDGFIELPDEKSYKRLAELIKIRDSTKV